MRKQKQIYTLAVVLACIFTATIFAEVSTVTGDISKVTVYRGQALVTRTIDVDLPSGTSELIVENLPGKIIPESLYAQTSGSSKVLSVRYREKAVKLVGKLNARHGIYACLGNHDYGIGSVIKSKQ